MGSRAVCLLPYLPLLILWALCLAGAQGNKFCQDGLSDDGLHCSGGCKFGSGTVQGGRLCSNDTLRPGLKNCKSPQNILEGVNRQNYTSSMTCTECNQHWNGTYCTQENIAYQPKKKLQDRNLATRRNMTKKNTLYLYRRRPSGTVIDFYTNDNYSRKELPNCSIEGCEWPSEGPSGDPGAPLRMKCRKAPKKKPKQLVITCPNNEGTMKLSEFKVYACAPFWSGLEMGCNQPCHCQDGVDCDPWTGQCRPEKGKKFCKDGLSDNGLHCSGGCKFGSGTKPDGKLCSTNTLRPGLKNCKSPQNILEGVNRQNYTSSMTCTECNQHWNGTYCTQENIAKTFKKNLATQRNMTKDNTLYLRKPRLSDTVIYFYTNDNYSRSELPNCSIEGCVWPSWGPSGDPGAPLRMECRKAPERIPKRLVITCPNNEGTIKLSKFKVYACAPFWSGLGMGCNQPCHCQDGVDCDPWTGQCPLGKVISLPTNLSSVGPVTSPSSLTTTTSVPTTTTQTRQGVSPSSPDGPPPPTTQDALTPSPAGFNVTETTSSRDVDSTADASTGRGVTEPPTTTTETDQGSVTSDPSTASEEATGGAPPALTTGQPDDRVVVDDASTTAEPTAASTEEKKERVTSPPYSVAPPTSVGSVVVSLKTLSPHTTLKPDPTTTTTTTTTMAGAGGDDDEDDDEDEESQASVRGGGGGEGEGADGMAGVWGAVGGMAVLMAVAVLAALVYRKKNGQSGKMLTHEDTPCVVDMEMSDRTPSSNDDEEENPYVNTMEPFSATCEPIAVEDFTSHLCLMKRVGSYGREYQELPSGILSPVTAAEEVNNGDVKKNRFLDISPYDESRVLLKKEKEADSDYINASYINGFAEAVAYIAAQGPLHQTLGDFWHMVWTEGCSRVIMLTNLVEGAKVKCERYWPDNEGSSQTFGAYTVTNVKVVYKAHFVLRSLKVTKQADEGSAAEASREVEQFHFTVWPDHGVPCPVALVRFWSWVVMHPVKLGGPMLVHCSAGIGRTGTLIALDMLTHQAETMGKVSIFPTVRRLRKQRVNMVQTLSQYKFLHQVVQEWLSCRHANIFKDDLLHGSRWKAEEGAPPTTLPPAITQQCAAQFKLLSELRPEVSDNAVFTAKTAENAAKNRSPHILPVEEFRVCLAKADDKDSDYINAAFLPSLTRQLGYVVTQLPLDHTVSHFWCMVKDWRVKTIVRFMDAPKDQGVCVFPDQGQRAQHGAISVHTDSRTEVTPGLSLYTLHLNGQETKSAGSGGQKVSVYCVESQQALSLKATKVFVSLVNILLPLTTAADQPPIVLQCFDGAGLSCVLCAVMMGVESLQEEERTNPFLLARLLHTAQPQALTTAEQYQFVVRCLVHYTRGITEEGDTEPATVGQQGKPEAAAVCQQGKPEATTDGQHGDPVSTEAELHIYSNVQHGDPVSTEAELHIYSNV